MKKRWLVNECVCGKKYSFSTEKEAYEYLSSPQAPYNLTYSYRCKVATNTWHVTSKRPNNSFKALSALESELRREMSKASEAIVNYMRSKYKNDKQTRFTAKEIKENLIKPGSNLSKITIQNAITRFREDGTFVVLDGKVPGTANGSYYTLSEILDKETTPEPKPEIKKEEAPIVHPHHKPAPLPKIPVSNPFDKVFSELGEIKSKVNGLAQGYSEIARKPMIQGEVVDTSAIINRLDEIKSALASFTPPVAETTSVSPFDPELFTTAVASAVNDRLVGDGYSDSLILRIRKEVIEANNNLKSYMAVRFNNQSVAQSKLMELVNSLKAPKQITNPDDYKQGIREGIRMAVELGITRIN